MSETSERLARNAVPLDESASRTLFLEARTARGFRGICGCEKTMAAPVTAIGATESHYLMNVGYGDDAALFARQPRFDQSRSPRSNDPTSQYG